MGTEKQSVQQIFNKNITINTIRAGIERSYTYIFKEK
jgi:hypothetical protein